MAEVAINVSIVVRIVWLNQVRTIVLLQSAVICLLYVSFRYATRLTLLFQFGIVEVQ